MNEVAWYAELMKDPNCVFVFGSNLAGRHGRGAALTAARCYGAKRGVGRGPTGQSYAFPTKDAHLLTRSLDEIRQEADRFIAYAQLTSGAVFLLTRVGCGLAGYSDEQIAPFFANAPSNVIKPEGW